MAMENSLIDDIRPLANFKGNTFSNFKKSEVKKQLEINLNGGKIEPACYWATEFICAGQYNALWDILFGFYFKHVHVGNIKACIYLQNRLAHFVQIEGEGYKDAILQMRNCQQVRTLFGEIICVLCESKRHRAYSEVKISPADFDLTVNNDKFRAPSTEFASHFFDDIDPNEIFVAMNEFAYNLSENTSDFMMCCYWMEWVISYNMTCVRNGINIECMRRHFPQVESKIKGHVVWVLWHSIIAESKNRSKIIENIIHACFSMYCFRFGIGCVVKRKYILYFAIAILTEPISFSEPIIADKHKLTIVVENIDYIYVQIKKNEQSTNTDYLFDGVQSDNLENTIEKLNIVSDLEKLNYT